MAEFTKDRYGVDVMKVEVPINMKFVEGAKRRSAGRSAYTRAGGDGPLPSRGGRRDASPSSTCRPASATPSSPSRWSSPPKRACKFSGVLCGRATWKDGIPVFGKQGAAAFRTWLESEGVENIKNVNDRAQAGAPVVRVLRREVSRRLEMNRGSVRLRARRFGEIARPYYRLRSVSTPLTAPRHVVPE